MKKSDVKLGVLVDKQFQRVLKDIVQTEKPVKAKAAYAISKILATVQAEHDRYSQIRNDLIKKYCRKDDSGELIVDDSGNVDFNSLEDREEFNKELIELIEVTVPVDCINISDIEAYELKPIDMLTIRDIVYEN